MFVNKRTSVLFCFLLTAFTVFAQNKTKEQLQKERKDNLKKIEEASKTLQRTSSKRKSSLGELNAIRYQIRVRKNVIKGIEEEIGLLDDEINDNLDLIASLEQDLANLKKEYAAMVYAAYKARGEQNKLTFLFSSASFNQLIRRMEYLKQYSEARQKQTEQIMAVQDMLIEENKSVAVQRDEKSTLLNDQINQAQNLASMQKRQESVIRDLSKEEKRLKRELESRRKSIAALDKLINDIIRKEAEEAARKAALTKTKASTALSEDFAKNRQKLPWPADGFVALKFGISQDPVMKWVKRNSPGIEIQTKPASSAQSVFSGEVTRVALIQGFNKAVIIKHGDFYSVYAKLDEVNVKMGDKVSVGEKIGTIFTDDDGITQLHFELWQIKENGTSKLNPELWLVKK